MRVPAMTMAVTAARLPAKKDMTSGARQPTRFLRSHSLYFLSKPVAVKKIAIAEMRHASIAAMAPLPTGSHCWGACPRPRPTPLAYRPRSPRCWRPTPISSATPSRSTARSSTSLARLGTRPRPACSKPSARTSRVTWKRSRRCWRCRTSQRLNVRTCQRQVLPMPNVRMVRGSDVLTYRRLDVWTF